MQQKTQDNQQIRDVFFPGKNTHPGKMVCQFEKFWHDFDEFWSKLYRNSERNAGIGKVTYLSGTGKFKDFINLECVYAVNYLKGSKLENRIGFYKQKCN